MGCPGSLGWQPGKGHSPGPQVPPRASAVSRAECLPGRAQVTLRHGGHKPLLVKSPVHMARVKLILRLFPRAKFVFIHRHPLEVFQSAAHMADTYYWYAYLQRPTSQEVTDFILEQGELLHRTYLRDRELIPPGNLHELSFGSLEADPKAALRKIYGAFGWDTFDSLQPALERYCQSLADFKKNNHRQLKPGMEAVVRERWRVIFSAFGYQ
mmetsp:Transcript_1786/g.4649  ORF Transcript_1786/g.4649 Transcript_1786/m.4649 type:complete len:211 (-) Transcript_1786:365-997(-)